MGITATRYGMEMEETARIEYTAHQQRTKCTKLTVSGNGIVQVQDPSDQTRILEIDT